MHVIQFQKIIPFVQSSQITLNKERRSLIEPILGRSETSAMRGKNDEPTETALARVMCLG